MKKTYGITRFIFMMLANVFEHILHWLTKIERDVVSSQPSWRVSRKLESLFYPAVKGRVIPKSDKDVIILIIVSLIVTLLEIYGSSEAGGILFSISSIITSLFLLEYLTRTYLRGVAYTTSFFGIIDLVCLSADVLIISIVFTEIENSLPFLLGDEASLIVFMRLIRIVRFIKFFQYKTFIATRVPYALPLIVEFIRSLIKVILLLGIPLLALYAYEPQNLLHSTLNVVFNTENFFKSGEDSGVDTTLAGLVLITVALLFINLVSAIFMPLGNL